MRTCIYKHWVAGTLGYPYLVGYSICKCPARGEREENIPFFIARYSSGQKRGQTELNITYRGNLFHELCFACASCGSTQRNDSETMDFVGVSLALKSPEYGTGK